MGKKSIYQCICKRYQKTLFEKLKEFVAIPSVYDESIVTKEHPFGANVSRALKWFENLASNDGFHVKNYDNKVVEVLIGDNTKKNITIMAHADVVPEGTGWTYNPFEMQNIKNVLYGRGVADDKGPLLAAYYALLALRDNKLLGDYQVRFLVGGNEENGSACMRYYFDTLKKYQPTLGFSPDSDFPLIHGEKSMYNFTISKKVSVPGLISLEGGVAFNSVIEKCQVQMDLNETIIPYLLKNHPTAKIKTIEDVVNITFIGKSAHGSVPQCGENAGMEAIRFIALYTKNKTFLSLLDKFEDVYGKGLNIHYKSKEMGETSLNVGLVSYNSGTISLVVNSRFPETAKLEQVAKIIKENTEGFKISHVTTSPLLYFSPKSKLVTTLLNSYILETGDKNAKPLTTGGGTYAKEANNVIAFGMCFPGWDPSMHGVDEKVRMSDLIDAMAIYARAIIDLGRNL